MALKDQLPVNYRYLSLWKSPIRRGLEELVDIRVAQLPVAAHVREVVAAELVDEGNINHHMPTIIEVGVLDDNNLGGGGVPKRRGGYIGCLGIKPYRNVEIYAPTTERGRHTTIEVLSAHEG